jgi:hypothetical protein
VGEQTQGKVRMDCVIEAQRPKLFKWGTTPDDELLVGAHINLGPRTSSPNTRGVSAWFGPGKY